MSGEAGRVNIDPTPRKKRMRTFIQHAVRLWYTYAGTLVAANKQATCLILPLFYFSSMFVEFVQFEFYRIWFVLCSL